jgi:hypothetical protein
MWIYKNPAGGIAKINAVVIDQRMCAAGMYVFQDQTAHHDVGTGVIYKLHRRAILPGLDVDKLRASTETHCSKGAVEEDGLVGAGWHGSVYGVCSCIILNSIGFSGCKCQIVVVVSIVNEAIPQKYYILQHGNCTG